MKTIEKKEPYLKLLDITGNIYEEFRPDQVLTHNNLNKLVDYFEHYYISEIFAAKKVIDHNFYFFGNTRFWTRNPGTRFYKYWNFVWVY